ncbi:amidohydrolase family protein [uncultured Sphingomonas sp.]|uniref:amidohydrolase family protein n=1 Tax=uncultured Sphingomonas sp. TaxID=158754 RepID=UPI0035CA0F1E
MAFSYPFMKARRDHQHFSGDTSSAFRPFLPSDLMAIAGPLSVEKAVHMQGHMGVDDPSEETAWLQSVADADGKPDGIVAFARLDDSKVEQVLEAHAAYPNHRGIRHSINWHPDRFYSMADRPDYLTDPAWQRGYALLDRFGMSFDLQIFPHQLEDSYALAAQHPGVPLIIQHCGFPIDRSPDGMALWRTGMAKMATLPNTVVKLSALVIMDHEWSRESLLPIIRETVDIFGPDRALFASNYPVDGTYIGYRDWVAVVNDALDQFGPTERGAIFYTNACRTYRL